MVYCKGNEKTTLLKENFIWLHQLSYFFSPDTSPELDEKEDPIDIKADFDANEDMDIRNETPEQ